MEGEEHLPPWQQDFWNTQKAWVSNRYILPEDGKKALYPKVFAQAIAFPRGNEDVGTWVLRVSEIQTFAALQSDFGGQETEAGSVSSHDAVIHGIGAAFERYIAFADGAETCAFPSVGARDYPFNILLKEMAQGVALLPDACALYLYAVDNGNPASWATCLSYVLTEKKDETGHFKSAEDFASTAAVWLRGLPDNGPLAGSISPDDRVAVEMHGNLVQAAMHKANKAVKMVADFNDAKVEALIQKVRRDYTNIKNMKDPADSVQDAAVAAAREALARVQNALSEGQFLASGVNAVSKFEHIKKPTEAVRKFQTEFGPQDNTGPV